jgi:hypothetical protein|mmetsp:Transcript_114765/g.180724  ORF Transcript_114765/g.180724 Transcript_114765/m.180724 type:complete len:324 (+) Transcript_114765:34-1005(+)
MQSSVPNVIESWGNLELECLLSSHFCSAGFQYFSPQDLARVEACCTPLRDALNSDVMSLIWTVCAQLAAERQRISLPKNILTSMQPFQIKSLLGNMQLASGSLSCTSNLGSITELQAVSCACSDARQKNIRDNQASQVIVGRLLFDHDDFAIIVADGAERELFCFSSDIRFSWPMDGSHCRDIKLTASLGCRMGINVLEVRSTERVRTRPFAITVDVRIVIPEEPVIFTVEGLEVVVDAQCTSFSFSGFDITDEAIRRSLTSQEGTLCTLTVRGLVPAQTPAYQEHMSALHKTTGSISHAGPSLAVTNILNALALSPLQYASA